MRRNEKIIIDHYFNKLKHHKKHKLTIRMTDDPKPAITPAVLQTVVAAVKAADPPKADLPPKSPFPETVAKDIIETPLDPQVPVTHTQFVKWVKEAGYVKKTQDKQMWEILMLIAWLSWISMVITFGISYLTTATLSGSFVLSWITFVPFVKEIGIGFTTVVIGQATKLLTQWYETKKKTTESI
jgi:hypothetical protein